MKIKCSHCNFDGEFKKGKVPFFTFSLLDSHIASYRAKKTFVCPECHTEIKLNNIKIKEPLSRVILYIIIALLILAGIIIMSHLNSIS